MTEVTKTQLAQNLGVSAAMISKHVKSGVLDGCFVKGGKKLYLEKAIQAIALSKKRDNEAFEVTVPENYKDAGLLNGDNEKALKRLLAKAKTPHQKVQITKDFWQGQINRLKFLESEGELISVDDAKKAINELLSPFNQYLDDLGNHLKNHFPDVSKEVVEWINDENNRQKEQLRVKQWED